MFQPVDEILINKTINSFDEKNNTFRMTCNNFLKEGMNIFAGDLKRRDNEELFDLIDEIVKAKEQATMFKFCPICKEEAPFTNRTCKTCKEKLLKLNDTLDINKTSLLVDPYNHFKNKATENKVKLIVGEPDILNPTGYENISAIMYNIGKRAKIDQYMPCECNPERKWLFVENDIKSNDEIDSGILGPTMKLIFNVYCCSKCEERIYGIKNFIAHLCFETLAIEPQHEFDWLIPQSGLLYFEMTAANIS